MTEKLKISIWSYLPSKSQVTRRESQALLRTNFLYKRRNFTRVCKCCQKARTSVMTSEKPLFLLIVLWRWRCLMVLTTEYQQTPQTCQASWPRRWFCHDRGKTMLTVPHYMKPSLQQLKLAGTSLLLNIVKHFWVLVSTALSRGKKSMICALTHITTQQFPVNKGEI